MRKFMRLLKWNRIRMFLATRDDGRIYESNIDQNRSSLVLINSPRIGMSPFQSIEIQHFLMLNLNSSNALDSKKHIS
jgi:hypothetical protein